ncbi:uncharacterized protein DUF4157 [Plasticicumulans lactativorans]|uniref:Uncharacterized protein DUF4157 n=1 Tax=Plasticicumulans lactativorans TaxID=1133106 RepID=A0A4R2L2F6_9GAMM|nr:DUF4157 domain-containing protein [Plasticicumulans lactativorans]TCO80654.1 uncharacterized protein DUF4157 [Plasticicumulans lactativorans]
MSGARAGGKAPPAEGKGSERGRAPAPAATPAPAVPATPAAAGPGWRQLALGRTGAAAGGGADPHGDDALARAAAGLAAPARPLDPATRGYFEHRYAADLSGVRLHDGAAAQAAAGALHARAFTAGQDIVLGARAGGADAREVLAHELAHVVQQGSGAARAPRAARALGAPGDAVERAADAAAAAALRPGVAPVRVGGHAAPGTLRLKPDDAKPADPDAAFQPLSIPAESADVLAQRGVKVIAKLSQQTNYVLFIASDALYAYSSQGKLLQTFKLTGPRKMAGFYLQDKEGSFEYRERADGVGKWVRVGWNVEDKATLEQWTSLTDADIERLLAGKVLFLIGPTETGGAGGATTPPPEHVPDPGAKPAGTPGATGSGKAELKKPLSGSEFEAGTGRDVANYPAFPARIATASTLVPLLGLGELTMYLDWTYGERELIGAVWNASTTVDYHWERWNVTAIASKGKAAMGAEAERRKQVAQDPQAAASDEYIAHNAQQRSRELREDIGNSLETIGSGGYAGTSPMERYHDVTTEVGNLVTAPASAITSAGGFLVDSVWHTLTQPENEIQLKWNQSGHYLIRCVASPREHAGRRYLSSVATALLEVRDADYIAQDTLYAADALMDELRLQRALTTDPAKLRKIDEQLAELEVGAHGSAVEALRLAVKKKQIEADAAIGKTRKRREDELEALQKQLEIAERNEQQNAPLGPGGSARTHALRPEAAIASEVTGATYPLLLQLIPVSQGPRPRWALYDVTTKGDKLGYAYVGQGDDDERAIADALRRFAADNDYGRGTVLLNIPDAVPNIAVRKLKARNVKRGDALAKQRLHDLMIILIALSLVIPGVGEAAMLLGGLLAAEHILERWKNGNLELDASLVTDVIAVLGALGTVGRAVGELRIIEAKGAYAVAVESGDAAAIQRTLSRLEGALNTAKAIELGNQIVGYGGLMWGNVQTLREIERINADEAEGRITHAQARSLRAKAVLGGIQNNVLMFAGPLQGARGGRRTGGEPVREPGVVEPRPGAPADVVPENVPVGGGAGAVRGRDVWELRDPSTAKGFQAGHGSVTKQLDEAGNLLVANGRPALLTRPTGAKAGEYTLEVAGSGGNPATSVPVKVEMVKSFDPASQPHAGEEGPARLDLVRSGGNWEATIRIHEMVKEKDISRLASHELDEIIDIVRGDDPTLSDIAANARAEEQMRAETFRPGALSTRPPTAHDRAAARELAQAYADHALAVKNGEKAKRDILARRIEAMEQAMGLRDPVGGRERAEALAGMGYVPRDIANGIKARAESLRAAASSPAPGAGARELPPEVVPHLSTPEAPSSLSNFAKMGIRGGHSDAELHAFVNGSSGLYRIDLVAEWQGPNGTTYRAYEQFMRKSASDPWVQAMDGASPLYKSTTDAPAGLIDGAVRAFDAWVVANGAQTGAPAAWGKNNGDWAQVGPDGVGYGGYATYDASAQRWRLETVYPDARWVIAQHRQRQAQQQTTPP